MLVLTSFVGCDETPLTEEVSTQVENTVETPTDEFEEEIESYHEPFINCKYSK